MPRRERDPDELYDAMVSGDRPDLAQRILGRDIRPTDERDRVLRVIGRDVRLIITRRDGVLEADDWVTVHATGGFIRAERRVPVDTFTSADLLFVGVRPPGVPPLDQVLGGVRVGDPYSGVPAGGVGGPRFRGPFK